MLANYHTHTVRCGHASGADREYVERAIEAGFKTLGFSDHIPVPFDAGYESRIRMKPELLPDYVSSLLALREEYRNDIRILIGFEAEYYPKYFDRTLALISDYPIDYLLLGQHFLYNEEGGMRRTTIASDSEEDLIQYVRQAIEGMETGRFSCLAHPDTLNFTGDPAVYDGWMRRLCESALKLGVPLELNLTGTRIPYVYPNRSFFRIAGEVGNPVILGLDAHDPANLCNRDGICRGLKLASACGLTVLDELPIVNPFGRDK